MTPSTVYTSPLPITQSFSPIRATSFPKKASSFFKPMSNSPTSSGISFIPSSSHNHCSDWFANPLVVSFNEPKREKILDTVFFPFIAFTWKHEIVWKYLGLWKELILMESVSYIPLLLLVFSTHGCLTSIITYSQVEGEISLKCLSILSYPKLFVIIKNGKTVSPRFLVV